MNIMSRQEKNKCDRKRFVYHGENWITVGNGGIGNKRCWENDSLPKHEYKKRKNSIESDVIVSEYNSKKIKNFG